MEQEVKNKLVQESPLYKLLEESPTFRLLREWMKEERLSNLGDSNER